MPDHCILHNCCQLCQPGLNRFFLPILGKSMKNLFDDHFSIIAWDNILHLLLGPVSFINHSCDPNAIYLKDYKNNVMNIKTLKDIKAGEELTVNYGAKYLKNGECICRTCQQVQSPVYITPGI